MTVTGAQNVIPMLSLNEEKIIGKQASNDYQATQIGVGAVAESHETNGAHGVIANFLWNVRL
jgi:hypothetical protein